MGQGHLAVFVHGALDRTRYRDLAGFDDLQERVGDLRIELPAGLGADFLDDPVARPSPPVGPVAGHRLERVAGMDDARLNGNALTAEPIRVASTVPSLVLRADDRSDPGQERDRGHDPL